MLEEYECWLSIPTESSHKSRICNFKKKQQERREQRKSKRLQTSEASTRFWAWKVTHTHTHRVAQTPLAARSNMTTQLQWDSTFTDHMKCSTSGFWHNVYDFPERMHVRFPVILSPVRPYCCSEHRMSSRHFCATLYNDAVKYEFPPPPLPAEK